MRDRSSLIGLNIALLAALAAVTLGPWARAREEQPGRKRGEYTMVGGQYQGGDSNAVFILDAVNQEMIALRWNEGSRSMEGIGYRDLAADAAAADARPGR